MSKTLRGNFKWLAGLASVSLLGACGAPGDVGSTGDELSTEAQELREKGDVAVSLSAKASVIGANESAAVTVTLTNTSRHPVSLLKWYAPSEELEESLFVVTRSGQSVAFEGPHYKRPAARSDDFLTLAPGESLTKTVDLGLYDLSQSGNYSIRFEVDAAQAHGSSARTGLLKSNDVSLWIEGRASKVPSDGPVAQLTSSVSFSGRCSTTQQATIMDALNAASAMADDSNAYLTNTTPSGTQRYSTWFGAFSSSGWSTAQTHFVAIKDAFDTKPITVDCSCKKNYYAYVYPAKPYIIYVCSAFWSAPMTGTDSKGGTLIHEMSHFTAVAGTDDHVYGQAGAKNLALTNPTNALDNADSHEYFAENTPFLQ